MRASLRTKAALLLMLIAAVLPELVVGSTPVTGLFNPIALVFLLLGYSLPVLVLREYIVRNRIGVAGIIALGVAFGIYNEGLWAKTMILLQDLPISQFDMYGRIAEVNMPWLFVIGLYHALAAVLLPIAIAHWRYKDIRDVPWLPKTISVPLAVGLLILACVSFLSELRLRGTGAQLIVLLFVMLVFVIIARFRPGFQLVKSHALVSFKAFMLGVSMILALIVLALMAEKKVPLPIFFVSLAALTWTYARFLKGKDGLSEGRLLMFGYGFYVQSALLGLIIGSMGGSIDRVVAGAVFVGVFTIAAVRLRRSKAS